MLCPVVGEYLQAIRREAFPRVDSADLLVASMGRLIALAGAALFPALNQWWRIAPPWIGALPILFYLFVLAPYLVWKRERIKSAALQDRLTPRFDMVPEMRDQFGSTVAGIVVSGSTNAVLRSCRGYIKVGAGRAGQYSGFLAWAKQMA